MSNRTIEEALDAVADRVPVDWRSAAAGLDDKDVQLLAALRELSEIIPASSSADRSSARRPLPLRAQAARWLSIVRVVLGAVGTITALRVLDIPRLPFVLAVLCAFAAAALILDAAGRDRRVLLLAFCYWMIAAAFASAGVTYLVRTSADLAWLGPLERLHPEVFLPAGMWWFAREFPRTTVLTRLDSACAWLARGCSVLGVVGIVLIFFRQIPVPIFRAATLMLAVPALLVLALRSREAAERETGRVRLFLSAFLIALAPVALSSAVDLVLPDLGRYMRTPEGIWLGWIAYVPLLALPFITAYAVAATTVLPVRVVLRDGLRYVLAKQVLLWSAVLAWALFVVQVYQNRERSLVAIVEQPAARVTLWTGVAALVLVGLRPLLLKALDRWALTGRRSYSVVRARMTERLRDARSPLEVAQVFAEGIEQALSSPSTCYLMRAGRLVPVDGAAVAAPADSLMPVLLERGEPCVVGEALAHSLFPLLGTNDQDWLMRSEIAVVAPLVTRGEKPAFLGILAIRRRRDAIAFSSDDLEFLQAETAMVTLACDSLKGRQEQATSAGTLEDVAVQCSGCGLVETWESSDVGCSCGGSWAPAVLPKLLGDLRIEQWLGAGAMGAVYRASDTRLERVVAVKTLTWLSPEAAERSLAEARTMARLTHANVAVLFGSYQWQGTPVLSMEYLANGTLANRLSRGPIDYKSAVSIAHQLASALEYLHATGLCHGDIKPSNIGLSVDGVPKFLDFGLSRAIFRSDGKSTPNVETSEHGGSPERLIGGTPAYLAPWAWSREFSEPSLDVWALSVVLCEMIVGRHPYGARRDPDAIADRVRTLVGELGGAVPEPLCDFMTDALAEARARRPETAADFKHRLATAVGRDVVAP